MPLDEYGKLSEQHTRDVVYSILNDEQRKQFESTSSSTSPTPSPASPASGSSCFFQRGTISAAFRRIPTRSRSSPT